MDPEEGKEPAAYFSRTLTTPVTVSPWWVFAPRPLALTDAGSTCRYCCVHRQAPVGFPWFCSSFVCASFRVGVSGRGTYRGWNLKKRTKNLRNVEDWVNLVELNLCAASRFVVRMRVCHTSHRWLDEEEY